LQLLAIYGLISLAWLQHWWQRRWWLAGFIAVALVLIPIWQKPRCFAPPCSTAAEPVLVIQDQGKVLLVNSGTARFAVLPFLQQGYKSN